MKIVAFFNNKGGVGKTSLVYHLSYMLRDHGWSVVAADLDPQANLSTMFMNEDAMELFWPHGQSARTVLSPLKPLLEGEGGIEEPEVVEKDGIGLLLGDLALSLFEDELSQQWPRCLDGDKRAFRVISGFHTVLFKAARARAADVVLVDVGPSLGSINRAALIAADAVVIPLAPDLFSLKGLENLGPRLREWRRGWEERLRKLPDGIEDHPTGQMHPLGYVVMQHTIRQDRPVRAYDRFMQRIPATYSDSVLGQADTGQVRVDDDPNCLATLRHYRSLMPLAQEARKPMFHLKAADGAIGAHGDAVRRCREDFDALAGKIVERAKVTRGR